MSDQQAALPHYDLAKPLAASAKSASLSRSAIKGSMWIGVAAFVLATSLSACGGKPSASADADAGKAKTAQNDKKDGKKGKKGEPEAPLPETPYGAVSSGKVDIEGGLVDVASRRGGIIREVFVQEGDEVKKGQILARQEDEESRLARDRVSAQLRQAEAQLPVIQLQKETALREQARLAALAPSNFVAQQKMDEARDNVKRADINLAAQKSAIASIRASLNEASYEVEQHVVRAPADGRIVRRYANPGVGASTLNVTPLFQLQPRADKIVRAEVEERSLTAIKIGQKVEIVPEADQSQVFNGTVLRIAEVMGARKLRSDDPSERTDERVVEVVVDAREAGVLVGQRVLVKFFKDPAALTAKAPQPVTQANAAN